MCESALRIADLTHSNTQNLPWLLRLSQITQSEQVSIGMCYYQVEEEKIMKRTTRSSIVLMTFIEHTTYCIDYYIMLTIQL